MNAVPSFVPGLSSRSRFACPLSRLQAELPAWLQELGCPPRTRQTSTRIVNEFCSWMEGRGKNRAEALSVIRWADSFYQNGGLRRGTVRVYAGIVRRLLAWVEQQDAEAKKAPRA